MRSIKVAVAAASSAGSVSAGRSGSVARRHAAVSGSDAGALSIEVGAGRVDPAARRRSPTCSSPIRRSPRSGRPARPPCSCSASRRAHHGRGARHAAGRSHRAIRRSPCRPPAFGATQARRLDQRARFLPPACGRGAAAQGPAAQRPCRHARPTPRCRHRSHRLHRRSARRWRTSLQVNSGDPGRRCSVRIAEMSRNVMRNLGVNWSALGNIGKIGRSTSRRNDPNAEVAGAATGSSASPFSRAQPTSTA